MIILYLLGGTITSVEWVVQEIYASIVQTHVLALEGAELTAKVEVAAWDSVSVEALEARGLTL